jgi:phage/plasmid primase-like uncharacterized protein
LSNLSQDVISRIADTLTRELGSAPAKIGITGESYVRWSAKNGADRNCYMRLALDKRPRLIFGDWSRGIKQVVDLSALADLSPEERARLSLEATSATRQDAKARAEAAEQMRAEWQRATPNQGNRYTRNKGYEPTGLRLDCRSRVLIPISINDTLISYQWIAKDGSRGFRALCKMKGGYFIIGDLSNDLDATLICEGWSTGAAIHSATNRPVIVAFSASNLANVAKHFHAKYPQSKIIICGDDDRRHVASGHENTGRVAAMAAARAVGGIAIFPEFTSDNTDLSDFHDMSIYEGRAVMTDHIENSLNTAHTNQHSQNYDDNVPDASEDYEVDGKSSGKDNKECAADELLKLTAEWETFSDPTGQAYAIIREGRSTITAPIPGRETRDFLVVNYKDTRHKFASDTAIKQVLDYLSATARRSGDVRNIYHRVAPHDGKIYLDLGNRVVEITANGWSVVDGAPVSFHRHPASLELPEPVKGGSIDELKKFINVTDPDEFVLVVAYLLAALRPSGPYPVLCINGENGSAKSTLLSIIKALIDPRTDTKLKLKPREEQTFIEADTRWIVDYDNLSGISAEASDTVCRISTGATYTKRKLYTDGETVSIAVCRPVVVNGIDQVSSRGDFADRSIVLNLRRIPDDKRRSEDEIWPEFEKARPRLLGALIDGVVAGLRNMPTTELAQSPRMADFAKWAVACEPHFWPNGTFLDAYIDNAEQAIEDALQSDEVGQALIAFMEFRNEWEGTATDLHKELTAIAPSDVTKDWKLWPKLPNTLSGRLVRAAKGLRLHGIAVEKFKEGGGNRTRKVRIVRGGLRDSRDGLGAVNEERPSHVQCIDNIGDTEVTGRSGRSGRSFDGSLAFSDCDAASSLTEHETIL